MGSWTEMAGLSDDEPVVKQGRAATAKHSRDELHVEPGKAGTTRLGNKDEPQGGAAWH